jgi:hypothetical protein
MHILDIRMRNSGFIIVGLVAVAAVAVSATTSLTPTYVPVNNVPADAVQCVDYAPPSTSDQVTYNGQKYDLIKAGAGIPQDKVKGDMKKIGVADGGTLSGKDLYQVPGKNYFGQPIGNDFVYVDSGKQNKTQELFNVYIKDGIAIPDFVTNCTSKGGDKQTINYWQTSQFPPAAFNATDIKNPGSAINEPAYIYTDVKGTYNALNQKAGVQLAGSLFVTSRNKEYTLYYHLGSVYLIDGNDAYEYIPTQQPVQFSSEAKENLQLKWFMLVDTPTYSWYTPDCKPAVYLYPTATQQTSVSVDAVGPLTETIPSYPQGGWNVLADPDGTIHSNGQTFPYLYYEAKIPDAAVVKPTTGYVVSYSDLPSLYSEVLPKLGLSPKETADFKAYWEKQLPFSPYYFMGVMPVKDVDAIEKLTVSPQPDTTIRVRVFFEALKDRKDVEAPKLAAVPQRNGFTAVEWGGMVKLHPETAFTCSQ